MLLVSLTIAGNFKRVIKEAWEFMKTTAFNTCDVVFFKLLNKWSVN